MNLVIPSKNKLGIFYEKMEPRLSQWQPSDAMAAAMICRLNSWPLWTPISEIRVAEFRSRVLKTAVDRWRQKYAKVELTMPPGLTRPEQHAVLRLGALLDRRERPLRQLTPRLLSDEFWTSFEWHSMQMGTVPHYGIFLTSPHLVIGTSTAYAARKIGERPPLFSESYRTYPLSPLHVIAINSGSVADAKAWHQRLLEIYDRQLPASPVNAKIPEQIVNLESTLAELEKLARKVLDTAIDSPAMLDAVCLESGAPPLRLLERMAAVPVQESGSEKPTVEAVIEAPEEELSDEPAEGPWAAPELRPQEEEGEWY